jgi:hypothetical protein
MLQKYLLAFALGGLIVGGVVYFTRRPATAPAQPGLAVTVAQPQAAPPTQAPQAALQEPEKPAPIRTPESTAPLHSARRLAKPEQPAPDSSAAAPPAETTHAAPQPQPAEQAQAPAPPFTPKHEDKPSPIMRPDPAVEAANRTPQTVTIPSGTVLAVRLRQLISTDRQSVGDPFAATLDQPIVIDGFVIAEKGSNVRGKITSLDAPGRVKGRASISLELTEINTTDGQRVEIRTDTYRSEAASGKKGDVAKIGAGAAIGAIIGAIAGGGKGAAIGAGVGGAAGGGTVLATKGEDVRLTSETRLTFRLAENVTLTEKLN